MPASYNHNICYQSRIFHAQTEARGEKSPFIATHLFLQGMVVASLHGSYQHLLENAKLEPKALEDELRLLMQQQHKQILKMLRRGELDAKVTSVLEGIESTEVRDTPPPIPVAPAAAARAAAPCAQPAEPPLLSMQPEPMLDPISALELGDEPLTDVEREMLARGQTISAMVAAVPVAPDGRIPFDHPAFEGFPMLEMDDGDQESLELDLEAITRLDFDQVSSPSEPGPVEPELELVILPAARPAAEPARPLERLEATLPAAKPLIPLRGKKPSLPIAPIAVELPEGIDTRKGGR